MVQKEIWMHLLAYNLLRSLMWQSAQQSQVLPLRMFRSSTTVQSVQTVGSDNRPKRHASTQPLLHVISDQLVPLRPHRAEPRVTKRRPKSFPRMQQPRSVPKLSWSKLEFVHAQSQATAIILSDRQHAILKQIVRRTTIRITKTSACGWQQRSNQ